MIDTPILFIIFNRPNLTQRIFDRIRDVKPRRLYIFADGPRESVLDDQLKCRQARSVVEQVDWDCEVFTLFSDSNLGCKNAVSSGINWFFNQVEEGIILEDDCLPDKSFFQFCELMLEQYRDDERVMQICGSNFLRGWRRNLQSYYFSSFGPIWGWASWRRAWQKYDVSMALWPEIRDSQVYKDFCLNEEEAEFRLDLYDRLYRGEIDTWDYQWGFAKMINSGLSIVPNSNLVSNIGFCSDATHTQTGDDYPFANQKEFPIEFPLVHPPYVVRDKVSDLKYLREFAFYGNNKPPLSDREQPVDFMSRLKKLFRVVSND